MTTNEFTRLNPLIESQLIDLINEHFMNLPCQPIDIVNKFEEIHGTKITTRAVGRVISRMETHISKQVGGVSWYSRIKSK